MVLGVIGRGPGCHRSSPAHRGVTLSCWKPSCPYTIRSLTSDPRMIWEAKPDQTDGTKQVRGVLGVKRSLTQARSED